MLLKTSVLAMLISILITVFSAIIGFILGSLIISKLPKYYFADWCFIPDKLNDYENYITAGTMDAFNFFGGIFGEEKYIDKNWGKEAERNIKNLLPKTDIQERIPNNQQSQLIINNLLKRI